MCDDMGNLPGLDALVLALSKEIEENPVKNIEETDIKIKKQFFGKPINGFDSKIGDVVSIRPVGERYKDKTFLGFYMGDVCVDAHIVYEVKTETIIVHAHNNPAIFVPELNEIIMGYESWWGGINSVDDLKQITDDDIKNVWYMKALKAFADV